MDDATVRAINALNRRFYRGAAREFDATRQAPWAGWSRLAPAIVSRSSRAPLAVLDAGCGNGRFRRFLKETEVAVSEYVGLDISRPLLKLAKRDAPASARHLECDLVADGLSAIAPGPHFDLIALIAVLHHVPSFARRRALLRACRARLAPGGVIVLSLWRFLDNEPPRNPPIPWRECSARTGIEVDPARVEPGDALLGFGTDPSHVRYAHHFDAAEAALLLAGLPLRCVDTFEADGDGRSNRYLVLESED